MSIAIFGLTVSVLAWAQLGWMGVLLVFIVIVFALVSGTWLARRMGSLATFLMAVAFAGVGFKVNFRSFLNLGLKAFLAGVVVSALTSILALLLVIYLYMPARGI